LNEQAYILSAFDKLVRRFAGKRIAIYGVGANTEYVLEHAADTSGIIGLMDARRAGETMYGYPVYSADEVAGAVDVIVIIARVAVVHLIYERIKRLAGRGMGIYDVNGENLADKYGASSGGWEANPYWNSSLAELRAKIDAHSVISFDIFDTLLMRKVLAPDDVFRLTQRAYEETFGKRVEFAIHRADAERRLNESGPATIEDIYASLELDDPDRQWLREKEFETELRVLTPRTDVVECFKYAVESGKRVYIVSDMYYGADALGAILRSNEISGHEDLIVSCEHGRTKETGGGGGIIRGTARKVRRRRVAYRRQHTGGHGAGARPRNRCVSCDERTGYAAQFRAV
jgi:hypothetical protein